MSSAVPVSAAKRDTLGCNTKVGSKSPIQCIALPQNSVAICVHGPVFPDQACIWTSLDMCIQPTDAHVGS